MNEISKEEIVTIKETFSFMQIQGMLTEGQVDLYIRILQEGSTALSNSEDDDLLSEHTAYMSVKEVAK